MLLQEVKDKIEEINRADWGFKSEDLAFISSRQVRLTSLKEAVVQKRDIPPLPVPELEENEIVHDFDQEQGNPKATVGVPREYLLPYSEYREEEQWVPTPTPEAREQYKIPDVAEESDEPLVIQDREFNEEGEPM